MNPDRQCNGTSVQSGERCKKPAILGGTVCEFHGGSAPQVKAAAARRLATDRARRRLDEVEVTDIKDPIAAFRSVVSEAVALKDVLASGVAALEDLRAGDSKWGTEQVRAEVAAYERAMDRCGRLLSTWVQLGLEERYLEQQAQLTRDQLRLLVGLALAVFDDEELGLPVERQATAARLLQEYALLAVEEGLTTGIVDGTTLVESVRPGWHPGERSFLELTPEQRQHERWRRITPSGHVAFDPANPGVFGQPAFDHVPPAIETTASENGDTP